MRYSTIALLIAFSASSAFAQLTTEVITLQHATTVTGATVTLTPIVTTIVSSIATGAATGGAPAASPSAGAETSSAAAPGPAPAPGAPGGGYILSFPIYLIIVSLARSYRLLSRLLHLQYPLSAPRGQVFLPLRHHPLLHPSKPPRPVQQVPLPKLPLLLLALQSVGLRVQVRLVLQAP